MGNGSSWPKAFQSAPTDYSGPSSQDSPCHVKLSELILSAKILTLIFLVLVYATNGVAELVQDLWRPRCPESCRPIRRNSWSVVSAR